MLKYPCLVLDHDDTVVQSEATVNYPFFCYILDEFRPGATITFQEYIDGCFYVGFAEMCRQIYGFTMQELQEEHRRWKEYVASHIPATFPGIERIIHRQKEEGGLVCVVSHSSREIITRDYLHHFGMLPDAIYGSELPEYQCKPNPYPLTEIMKTYNLQPHQLLVVDDLKPAWQMANAVGSPIVFAQWGKLGQDKICEEMTKLCNYAFESVAQLESFLFEPL